tara:strand:- start:2068 stop:2574 length:507 start_codon:yes stop_codon:yes gene_type:complete
MSSQTQFKDIFLEEYTDRSIVVRGETRQYKEDLKKLGGKYNSRLRGEPGWIFPKSKQNDIVKFMKEGKRLVSEEEVRAGEARTLEWESLRSSEQKTSSSSINDNKVLIDMIKTLTQKIEKMDKKISILMTANNTDTNSKQIIKKKSVESSSDDDSSDEDEAPRKRFLK